MLRSILPQIVKYGIKWNIYIYIFLLKQPSKMTFKETIKDLSIKNDSERKHRPNDKDDF